jgi:hypothetical protein
MQSPIDIISAAYAIIYKSSRDLRSLKEPKYPSWTKSGTNSWSIKKRSSFYLKKGYLLSKDISPQFKSLWAASKLFIITDSSFWMLSKNL